MYKVFRSTINDLTERGLTKEAYDLYEVFVKTAALNEERIKKTLNLTNPITNPEEKERAVASRMLVGWLRDKSKSFFTNNELANYIVETDYDNFASPDALGGSLMAEEIRVLKELVEQKGSAGASEPESGQPAESEEASWGRKERDDSKGSEPTSFPPEEISRLIDSLMERQGETVWAGAFFVKLARTGGRLSDAAVSTKIGEMVSFVVPVDSSKLGVKVHSLSELAEMGAAWSAAEQKVVFG